MHALALLLLGQITAADPIVALEHDPIEVTSGLPIAEGWTAEHDWTVTKPAAGRQYENGNVFAVWGPPGQYEIRHKVTAVNFDKESIVGKVEYVKLEIRPRGPPPTPTPPDDPRPNPPSTDAELAATWAAQTLTTPIAKTNSAQAARLFLQVASGLADGNVSTIADAIARIEDAQWPVPNQQFRQFTRLLWNEWDRRVPEADNPRAEAVKLLKAAGDGLELYSRG